MCPCVAVGLVLEVWTVNVVSSNSLLRWLSTVVTGLFQRFSNLLCLAVRDCILSFHGDIFGIKWMSIL